MDRPLAKYEAGRLWLDKGFTDYTPSSRSEVNTLRASFARRTREAPFLTPLSADYERQIEEAIKQFDAAMEEAK